MGSEALPLHNNGIFKNLPTFSPEIQGLTAIVTGANGISGFFTMRVLLENPHRWHKIWTLSRSPPPKEMMDLLRPEQRDRVEHISVDFLGKPEDIASAMKAKGVTADAVFFYSYLQPKTTIKGAHPWANAQELADVNSTLLGNLLDALPMANIKPKRFLLQTGAKNYNVHQGPARTPFVESDPRRSIEPNFYYPQEDKLFAYCKATGADWNIICPAWIIGAVSNATMNALHPLAVYAAVQAHKNEELHFPGDYNAWLGTCEHSTAMLTGYLSEWAVLEDKCANQKFNASDGCPLPNNRLWPELARWYGSPGHTGPELDESKITTIDPGDVPTPLGYGPSHKTRYAWTLVDWAKKSENHDAWKEIMSKHGLTQDPFEDIDAHFTYGDAAAWGLAMQLSMNKAKYFGFTGHVDTLESLFWAYGELNKLKMLPPLKVERANALI